MSDPVPTSAALSAADVESWRARLVSTTLPPGSDQDCDARRVELLTALERLKNTAAAVQAQLGLDLDSSVRTQHARAGLPADQQGRGVASQVALARRESPHRGQQLLGLARDLAHDHPHAFAAWRSGALSEYRATVVARESGCLAAADRRRLDAELFATTDDGSAEPAALAWGTRYLAASARAVTYRLDPAAAARRSARAADDRRVTLRPAPDTMTYLTALLPVAQGVAAYAQLRRDAAALHSAGDPRSRGRLMADLLVHAVTATDRPALAPSAAAPTAAVTVELVMPDTTLLGGGHEPAWLIGRGVAGLPVPAQAARDLVADALDGPTGAWVGRLYADPGGDLVALSSTQRFVRGGLAEFLRIRDRGLCRTPWCDAPIAEYDHVVPVAENTGAENTGGPDSANDTSAANTQGLCAACNRAKQAPGWRQRTDPHATRHTVRTTTPSGQRYRSVVAA